MKNSTEVEEDYPFIIYGTISSNQKASLDHIHQGETGECLKRRNGPRCNTETEQFRANYSDEVERVQFTSRFFLTRPHLRGYDEKEVDDYLDEIVQTLQKYEQMCMALDKRLHNCKSDRVSAKFIRDWLVAVGWNARPEEIDRHPVEKP